MVRLPKKVKIGFMNYDVQYPMAFEDDSSTAGLHKGVFGSIQLSKISSNGLPRDPQRIVEAYIHEIMHGVDLIFCNDAFSENTIELISRAWIQVVADNDLFLKDDTKYPEKVKVGPFYYSVFVGNNDFKGTIGDVISAHNSEQLCIKIATNDAQKFHPKYIKSNFVHVLFCAIMVAYSIEQHSEDKKDFSLKILSNGVYQVFLENNLEEIIKEHFK
jgi:hypothetical protein